MTIAVIKTGGKQYKVTKGQQLNIEKIAGEKGDKIEFDKVLLVADVKGTKVEIGKPFLKDKKVEAEIVEQFRDRKIDVIKFKRKTRYKRKAGHRQQLTAVKISKI